MKEYQKRVCQEQEDIDAKRLRLLDFMKTNIFDALPSDEKRRLQNQEYVMWQYSEILGERIANFSA